MKGLFLYDESLYKILPDELIKDISLTEKFELNDEEAAIKVERV